MGGMWRLGQVVGLLGFCLVVAAAGCVAASGCNKSANTEGTTATTASSEETQPKSSRPSRSEVACRLHSCAAPYFCNEDKGICERLPCVSSQDCPYDYKCDFSLNVCQ